MEKIMPVSSAYPFQNGYIKQMCGKLRSLIKFWCIKLDIHIAQLFNEILLPSPVGAVWR